MFYKRSDADDKFETPLKKIFDEDYKCYNLKLHRKDQSKNSQLEKTIFIDPFLYIRLIRLWHKFSKSLNRKKRVYTNLCVDINKIINDYFKDIEMTTEETIELFENFLCWRYFLFRIMSFLKPRIVFIVGYYSLDCMALVSACKSLKIKTVDIQHGKVGRYQPGYTHWNKDVLTREGYDVLPNFFWVWGKNCLNDLKRWTGQSEHHVPIIGGYPWLSGAYQSKTHEEKYIHYEKTKELKQYERVILVTLQNIINNITEPLLYVLNHSPRSWKWLIRFHPVESNEQKKQNISLFRSTIANVEWEYPSDAPLFDILPLSHYHVTLYSSSCIEALAFGVPSILIDKTGVDVYEDYIKDKIFNYAETGEKLLKLLEKDPKRYNIESRYLYIETSKETVKRAIKTIFHSTS